MHLIRGGLSVSLCGAGLCICIDAGILKMQQSPWFLQGLVGLIIFNSGISLMGYTVIKKIEINKAK